MTLKLGFSVFFGNRHNTRSGIHPHHSSMYIVSLKERNDFHREVEVVNFELKHSVNTQCIPRLMNLTGNISSEKVLATLLKMLHYKKKKKYHYTCWYG